MISNFLKRNFLFDKGAIMKKIIFSLAFFLFTLSAHAFPSKILNLFAHQLTEDFTSSIIKETDPDLIFILDTSESGMSISKLYPFSIKDENCILFSKEKIDFFKKQSYDDRNFILFVASENYPYCLVNPQLPDLSHQEIQLLESYLKETHPYLSLQFMGDFSLNNLESDTIILCGKSKLSHETSINEKKEATTSMKASIETDNGRHKLEAQGSMSTPKEGENRPKAEAKIKYEFSYDF